MGVVNPFTLQEARMRSVVVTGTSTGIGWGIAKVLTTKGFRVFGSVRKKADADRLSAELGSRFVPLLFDVTDEAAVQAAATEVRAALGGETLAGLVNNAGIAVAGPLLTLPISEFRRQIDTNLVGAVIVIQAFAPLLGTDRQLKGRPGRILNISSVGGRVATPFLAPYHASKFGVEGLSESLRRELLCYEIDVIVIAPGAVATAIWGKVEQIDVAPYVNTPYAPALERLCAYMVALGKGGLPPERLGQAVMHALTTTRPKVRYAITPQPIQDWLGRNLPKRLIDRMIGKWLGLLPARR
jgi:NAD(P)-dependent dehydrogenase (short-subunit alcohol dehydrogenase family)